MTGKPTDKKTTNENKTPVTGERIWNRQVKDGSKDDGTTIIFYKFLDCDVNIEQTNKAYEELKQQYALSSQKMDAVFDDAHKKAFDENPALSDPKFLQEFAKVLPSLAISNPSAAKQIKERLLAQQAEQYIDEAEKLTKESTAISDQVMEAANNVINTLPLDSDAIKGKTLKPPSLILSKKIEETFRNIEGAADIRYFNMDALSSSDLAYLQEHHIEIPDHPDQLVAQVNGNLAKETTLAFVRGAKLFQQLGNAVPIIFSDLDNAPYKADVRDHEILHALGLEHQDNPAGSKNGVNYRTVMPAGTSRYNSYFPDTFQEDDLETVKTIYGPSKHPSDLPKKLELEEKALAGLEHAKELLSAKMTEYLRRGKLDADDLVNLRMQASVLFEPWVTGEFKGAISAENLKRLTDFTVIKLDRGMGIYSNSELENRVGFVVFESPEFVKKLEPIDVDEELKKLAEYYNFSALPKDFFEHPTESLSQIGAEKTALEQITTNVITPIEKKLAKLLKDKNFGADDLEKLRQVALEKVKALGIDENDPLVRNYISEKVTLHFTRYNEPVGHAKNYWGVEVGDHKNVSGYIQYLFERLSFDPKNLTYDSHPSNVSHYDLALLPTPSTPAIEKTEQKNQPSQDSLSR